jgi:hypothetical protein
MPDQTVKIGLRSALNKWSWGAYEWGPAYNMGVNQIHLLGARNEVLGFQVCFLAEHDFVLTLDRTNWLHALGFCPRLRVEVSFLGLPAEAVETFAVGYVEGDDHRQWMETLDRAGYAEVPAGKPQVVYVRLKLPGSLPAGIYEGMVRVFSQFGFEDEALAWQGAIHLQIMDVRLPDVKDWCFHLNLWQHCTSIARFHRVALWSEAHFALIDRYYASLSRLGQKAVSVIAAEIPWSGQRCFRDPGYPSYLFEHAVIEVSRGAKGELQFDYSKLDRLLDLAAQHGIDREIDIFGLANIWVDEAYGFGKVAPDAPDAVRVRCYDPSTACIGYLRTASELSDFIRSLHAYFERKGLLERVRICADEPADLQAYQASVAFIRQAAPGFKHIVFINHFEFLEDAPAEVVDCVPVLPLLAKDLDLSKRLVERLHQKNGKMLWYVCCWPPIPNTFLHSPLVEGELHGWLTHYFGVDGFIRWAFCLWTAEPWQRVSWRAPDWHAGDMYFVLPGKDGAPVETLRYEALRAGIQDYELLKLVEKSLPPGEAQAVIEQALRRILRAESGQDFARVGQAQAEELYSLDPQDYQEARRVLLEALSAKQ